ncbi:MAG TPA: D-aminoacyl-tRNA deacylase, partial [Steroidobacteraceae bacterium]|nr:D-aminoacyl-tRNA deacylase [Steroidobacteraceae bacterium]
KSTGKTPADLPKAAALCTSCHGPDGVAVASIYPSLAGQHQDYLVRALIGVARGDSEAAAERLLERLLGYRIFADADGRMNVALREHGGGLLLVPQFTLAADTHKGTRAGFSTAAEPAAAQRLFGYLLERARSVYPAVSAGVFGAHMQVSLVNDGPVTFWLEAS